MIGGAYIMIQGSGLVYVYCIEHCELRKMYVTYTCCFTCLTLATSHLKVGVQVTPRMLCV